MIEESEIDATARIYFPDLSNIYGCTIGAYSAIGPFVEIQRNVTVGKWTKIESHTFICSHVSIGNYVFIGHGVTFTNDVYPAILGDVVYRQTTIADHVSIGSGATVLPVAIGEHAIIGAGSVVTRDVTSFSIVAGNPAKVIRQFTGLAEKRLYLERHNSHTN